MQPEPKSARCSPHTGIRRCHSSNGAGDSSTRAGRVLPGRTLARAATCHRGPTRSSSRRSPKPGAVHTPFGVGFGLAAPTLLAHGSDDVKDRFLRRDGDRRIHLVPVVQRSRERIRPRGSHDPRNTRRRRVDRQRAEAVEHERAPRRLRAAPGAHRLGRPQTSRDHVLRAADAPAGRAGAVGAPDERPRVVQRDLPDRHARSERQCRRRTG